MNRRVPGAGRVVPRAATRPAAARRQQGPPRKPSAGGAHYRGGAIQLGDRSRQRRRRRRAVALLGVLGLVVAVAVLAAPAGRPLARRAARVASQLGLGQAAVVVRGNLYLTAAECLRAAGLEEREPYFRTDLDAARRRLAAHPRVRTARAARRLDGRIELTIDERLPLALLSTPRVVEVDADGRVLPPLVAGSVADLPVLRGPETPAGGRVRGARWLRARAWVVALGSKGLRLLPRVSEVDVREARVTRLVLSPSGTRVHLPAEPGGERLQALRIVLADLEAKGVVADEIECRTDRMVVVRPRAGPDGEASARSTPPSNKDRAS